VTPAAADDDCCPLEVASLADPPHAAIRTTVAIRRMIGPNVERAFSQRNFVLSFVTHLGPIAVPDVIKPEIPN